MKKMKKIGAAILAATMSFTMLVTVNFPASAASNSVYEQRFNTLYNKIHDPANGYFSQEGIPYHSVETLMVEGPDYGHETSSETFSFYMWLEAMKGKISGDYSSLSTAWSKLEKYLIPASDEQPGMSTYKTSSPAGYAKEGDLPSDYPVNVDSSAPVGQDPLSDELKSTYNTSNMYLMHWIIDTDNWYGYGNKSDGTSRASKFNNYQRGPQESCWETVPFPSWESFKWGGSNGFLGIFINSDAKQWRYTNAPDAEARTIQAVYWAEQWAKDAGKSIDSTVVSSTSKMGDYARYNLCDKFFRKIGSPSQAATGKDSMHYLINWYTGWGGALDGTWSWKQGCSFTHFGYQSPIAAYALSQDSGLKVKSSTGATDWDKSLKRQLEFYQWLQSSEGAIAGGATNSINGRYEAIPSGTSTFYGMAYDEDPVYHDPSSNKWFGMQTWSMQRLAEYLYKTNDATAKKILDKWVSWVKPNVHFTSDGDFEIPSDLAWKGQPDTWSGTATSNSNLHVSITKYGQDLGIAASLANTLSYYYAATKDTESKTIAKGLLDCIWNKHQDTKGVSVPEKREDYKRFFDEVYIPSSFTGKNAQGADLKSGATFISIRPKYKLDPDWSKIQNYHDTGVVPEFTYHRFWGQVEVAVANGIYAWLCEGTTGVVIGDVNDDTFVDALDLAKLKMYLLDKTVAINKANSDVNQDGGVDALDLAQLKINLLNKPH